MELVSTIKLKSTVEAHGFSRGNELVINVGFSPCVATCDGLGMLTNLGPRQHLQCFARSRRMR